LPIENRNQLNYVATYDGPHYANHYNIRVLIMKTNLLQISLRSVKVLPKDIEEFHLAISYKLGAKGERSGKCEVNDTNGQAVRYSVNRGRLARSPENTN
jgi:hypothetical protein